MKNKKVTYITIGALIFVSFSIFFITILLQGTFSESPTSIKKSRAASLTYSRTIPVNSPTPTPKIDQVGTVLSPSPLLSPSPSPLVSPTIQISLTQAVTPSPTKSIITPTVVASVSATLTPTRATSTPTPTIIAVLPQSGIMTYSMVFTASAVGLIFLSLLF